MKREIWKLMNIAVENALRNFPTHKITVSKVSWTQIRGQQNSICRTPVLINGLLFLTLKLLNFPWKCRITPLGQMPKMSRASGEKSTTCYLNLSKMKFNEQDSTAVWIHIWKFIVSRRFFENPFFLCWKSNITWDHMMAANPIVDLFPELRSYPSSWPHLTQFPILLVLTVSEMKYWHATPP